MNIFVLNQNPYEAARQHCDKHVVKMILEYGQMLSTSHRLLDGQKQEWTVKHPDTGRDKRLRFWQLEGEKCQPLLVERQVFLEGGSSTLKQKWTVHGGTKCYAVAHANHPCSMWARETDANYHWLFHLFDGAQREYTHRYGKRHAASRLNEFLSRAPSKIRRGQLTPFPQAMPDEYKTADAVEAYRRFYAGSKARFAKWTNTPVPDWFLHQVGGKDASVFQRTR